MLLENTLHIIHIDNTVTDVDIGTDVKRRLQEHDMTQSSLADGHGNSYRIDINTQEIQFHREKPHLKKHRHTHLLAVWVANPCAPRL